MTNQSIGFLAKKFLQMEEENNLFELENEEEICIWDIFRYVVYIRILSLHGIMPNALNFRRYEFSDIKSYLRIIKIVYKTGLNRVLSIRRLKSECDTVIFSLSRFLTDDLNPVDHLLNNYIKATTEDKMLIELFNSKKFSFLKGNHEGRYFPHEIQLGYIFCKRSELDFLEISKIINSTFGINVGWNEWLNEIYHRFNVEKKVYQNIFTKVKAKKVLFQGPSKSIVAAANSVGAVTIDVLHGQVNRLGIAYWYSDKIEYANFLTIPDYLLTMGEYWNSQVSMPSKVFCVGNDYFFLP